MSSASNLATAMRYRDVAAAADWLCAAFGFENQTVAADQPGAVPYAQLTYGNAMLMLGPVRDTTLDRFMKQPDEIGGAETQSCYFVVDDADAHCARAKQPVPRFSSTCGTTTWVDAAIPAGILRVISGVLEPMTPGRGRAQKTIHPVRRSRVAPNGGP
jgi:uncharacterized glyoxalase superfamily protein PhnB